MRTYRYSPAIAGALIVFALGVGSADAAGPAEKLTELGSLFSEADPGNPSSLADEPPVAIPDDLNLNEDAPATAADVLANDDDPDGGEMTIESAGTPEHGTAALTGGGTGITYTPAPDSCGADAFDYTLNGGSTATVSIAVTCLDDLPKAVNDIAILNEDAPATSIPVLTNDTDVDGGPKSIVSVGVPKHGTTEVTGGGTGLTYKPTGNYCDPEAFSYTLNGGSTATVTVEITCLDDPPYGADDTAHLKEDDPATEIPVLDNDPDIDPGERAVESATQPSHGTITITGDGSILLYEPNADYCGLDSFVYTLNGNATAMVTVVIACVDDLPVAKDDSHTVVEDADVGLIAVLANDTDADGGPKLIARRGNAGTGAVGAPAAARVSSTRPLPTTAARTTSPTPSTGTRAQRSPSPSPASTTRRPRFPIRWPSARTPARSRSRSWSTTSTSTADRAQSPCAKSPVTARHRSAAR